MKKPPHTISWPTLCLGMLVTGACALGVHTVMLDALHVPYPGNKIDASIAQFISRGFLHVLALIYVNDLAQATLSRRPFYVRWAVIFVVSTMLTEALIRLPFMNGYCSDSLAYAFLANVPILLHSLMTAALIAASTRFVPTFWHKAGAALLVAAFGTFVLTPMLQHAFAGMLRSVDYLSHPNWCELPYGWNVLIPADLTFIEPVLATMGIAALVWDRLSARPAHRIVQFVLLIMLIRRQLLAAFIYMAYSGEPPLVGLASMGQFSLEAMLLGLLGALTWQWARRGGRRPAR